MGGELFKGVNIINSISDLCAFIRGRTIHAIKTISFIY
jgi:hypothetical protein